MPRKGVSASRHVLAEARLGLHKRSGPKGTGRGKRRAGVLASEAQLAQAEENLRRLKEEVAVTIERSYNKLERTRGLVQVASQVVKLRQESERLAQNQLTQGVILASERKQAAATSYQAQTDFLQAKLGYLLAWAELEQANGHTPGLP